MGCKLDEVSVAMELFELKVSLKSAQYFNVVSCMCNLLIKIFFNNNVELPFFFPWFLSIGFSSGLGPERATN